MEHSHRPRWLPVGEQRVHVAMGDRAVGRLEMTIAQEPRCQRPGTGQRALGDPRAGAEPTHAPELLEALSERS